MKKDLSGSRVRERIKQGGPRGRIGGLGVWLHAKAWNGMAIVSTKQK